MADTTTRVVLCDDQPDFVQLLRLLLELEPDLSVVGTAGRAREAIERCADLRPDVLVLDVSMPGMDGITALPEIKQVSPHTCVVVLSGFSSPEVKQRALDAGAVGFVEKGAAVCRLPELVRQHCA